MIRFAEQGAKTIDTFLDGHISELESISANSIVSDPQLPIEQRLGELEKQLGLDNYKRLSIADTNGKAQATDGIKVTVDDREYFQKAIKGVSNVSDPLLSRADGTMVIVFAVPIIDGDKIIGILYATYDADVLSSMTDKIKINSKGGAFILDRDGYTIAHENRSLVYGKDNDFINVKTNHKLSVLVELEKKMISGQIGSGDYEYNGISKYMGYCPIGETGWSIAVTSPKSEILGLLNIVFIILIISVLAATFLIAGLLSNSKILKTNLSRQQVNSTRIADVTNLIVISIDLDGVILSKNKYAERFFDNFSRNGSSKILNIYELLTEYEGEKFKDVIISAQLQKGSASFELALKREGCDTHYLYCSLTGDTEVGETMEIMGLDITERVESQNNLQDSFDELSAVYDELAEKEEGIRRLAYTDSLTGLPNRAAFYSEMQNIISQYGEANKCALIYMDLDNFKYVNDSFSHYMGDLLLVEVGKRLKGMMTDNEFLTRLEGDEFVVFVRRFDTSDELAGKIQAAMDAFHEPYNISGNNFHITVSSGISIFPEHAASIEEILKNSDMAMYHAKKNGKHRCVIFEKSMNDEFVQRINMENGLRRAIVNNEFILHYQPQIDLITGGITGFEALIRWMNPQHGMIPPLKFIGVTEETGLIVPIGRWVMLTACSFIKRLNETEQSSLGIAVNVSAIQLLQTDFVQMVREVLKETALDPKLLELELTESKLIEAVGHNLQKLTELRDLGVRISIDDFGKGFSSLSYLNQLPINSLKIDKSFVDDIQKEGNSMIESIIHIGHQRGLVVIAEGAEKKEQIEYLSYCNCDKVQGYYYSRPVPEEDVRKLLQ